MKTQTFKLKRYISILMILFFSGIVQAEAQAEAQVDPIQTDVENEITTLREHWAKVNYDLQGDAQNDAFKLLVSQAENITKTHPDSAEAWIWLGIIKSSYAGAKGGLGALGLVKESRAALEKALSLDDKAMQGSAYTSLGALFFKVPGWPIAFGDDEKAEQLLKQALKINPDGIDPNYFYADFLLGNGEYAEAKRYLLKAQHAAPRPAFPLEDKGRQQQISSLLVSVEKELAYDVDLD